MSKHDNIIPLSKATACYVPEDYSAISHIPSATATEIELDEYSSPMFIEAEHIICYGDIDPFIDSGYDLESEAVLADAVTADEITTCDPIIAWPECYDAIVIKNEKHDPFQDLNSDFLKDDLLFAEIINDIAASGFEEEKNDCSIPRHNTLNIESNSSPPYLAEEATFPISYSSDDLSDSDFYFDSITTSPLSDENMTFSLGGPKPATSHLLSIGRHSTQSLKPHLSSASPQLSISSPKYPPKPVREIEKSLQKQKDKRAEKLNEARVLDARQIATSKRERSNGKFAKRKINWVSITEMV